jgi:MFS family permease
MTEPGQQNRDVGARAEQAGEAYLIATRRGVDLFSMSLMFVFVMSAVTLSLMPVVTSQLRTDLQLTDAEIGLLTSIFMGFYAATGLMSGFFAPRWGGRLLGVSCGCFFLGSLLFALSSSFPGFLVGRAFQGLGGGMVVATCNTVLAHSLPAKWLGRAWGIVGIGFGLGSLVALFVLLTTAGLSLAVGAGVIPHRATRALPQRPEGTTTLKGLAVSLGAAAANPRVIILGITNAAGLALGVAAVAWAPSFLQDIYGMSQANSVYIIAGLGVAQVIGNPLGVVAAAKWGKYRVVVGGMIIMLVTTVIIGIVPGVPLVAAMVIIPAFFGMFYFPAMLAYIPEVVDKPEQVGPASGLNTSLGFVGSLVAPWLFGLILDSGNQSKGSYAAGFAMLGAFGIVALVALLFFRRGARPPVPEPTGER